MQVQGTQVGGNATSMVGYNVEGINELIGNLNASYSKLGEVMASDWKGVSLLLESEWIGPDEVSFETELANRICDLYEACSQSITDMVTNVRKIGESWQEFQNSNILSGATIVQNNQELSAVNLEVFDIRNIVKAGNPTFTSSTQYGVTSGDASATVINDKVTAYITNIHDQVSKMYSQMSAASAFLGANQAETIREYLERMAQSVAKLTTCVDDLRTSLKALVEAYTQQATAFNTSISGIDTTISAENSIL